jgi:uncharacterized membrane protein YfcA
MTGGTEFGLIAAAGVLAGIVGTAGGITSLVSYPALLAAGLSPVAASIANNVALVACWPGSALASRPELQGRGQWLRRWAGVAAAGGAAGAVLLLSTPERDFARIVPFLVAAGSLALLAQPWISARRPGLAGGSALALLTGLLAVSAYNGYFGAGAGVLTLGLMLVTADDHMARANALKNMLIGASSLMAALAYTIAGPVDWRAVVPLGIGMLAGSMIGPRLARRLPARVLRWLAALLGLVLAARLWMESP